MYNDILRYRRSLKKQLRCGPLARKKLLDRFGGSLAPFLEENPAPGYEQLVSAFGPPEEMAAILMESVSAKEQARYQTGRKLIQILAVLVAVLFLAFVLYVFFVKEYSVIKMYDTVFPGYVTYPFGGN